MNDTLLDTALPRANTCAAMARRVIRGAVGDEIPERALQDLLTVATELVDNAFVHGEGEIRIVLRDRGDRLLIEVVDEGEGQSVLIREQAAEGVGGWGLRIIAGLSDRWGAFEGTTHVWAELPKA